MENQNTNKKQLREYKQPWYTSILFVLFITFFIIPSLVFGTTYYVAPGGSDANPGTQAQPFQTFQKAVTTASNPGDIVYFRAGTYLGYVSMNNSGTAGNPITFAAYPGETPVINGSNKTTNIANPWNKSDYLIVVGGNYITIKGIEVKNSAGFGIYVRGNNVVIDNVHAHNNYFAGIYFYMCSYGTVVNCTVHDSYDYGSGGTGGGGNADCIASSASNSPPAGNNYGYHTFRNNLIYNCSDDGIDTWTSHHNTIEGNIVHHAGYSNSSNGGSSSNGQPVGNGNGFKLGGGSANASVSGNNIVQKNVSYSNRTSGFDCNSGSGLQVLNNTAYDNPTNFLFYSAGNTLKNNLSYSGSNNMSGSPVQNNNSWNLGITNPQFANVNPTSSNFLRLSAGSPAIDAGVNVSLPYNGIAPDLGAFEYDATTGVNQLNKSNVISVYPNPFTTNFTLKISSEIIIKDAVIKIYDVCGKEVRTISINAPEITIEKSELQNGIYFYNLINNNESITKGKLVIQ